jgi:3-isopropylmalate dehydrogenase
LSNQALALSGGLGLACSLNMGDRHAAANAGHGSAPDIAGLGVANPTGMILSTAMLLAWLGQRHGRPEYEAAAASVDAAVDRAMIAPATRTVDLGGAGTTVGFAATIVAALREPA